MIKLRKKFLSVFLLSIAIPLAGCVSDSMFADEPSRPYGGSKMHPIKVENGRASVENCGEWSSNVADTESNEMHANHGCAVQSNIAAMAAYPSDLTGKKRKLPKPLGDVQYNAIKKITSDGSGGGSSAPSPTP
jgi:Pilus biogenesis CpaD protein (pilus_cpaD)